MHLTAKTEKKKKAHQGLLDVEEADGEKYQLQWDHSEHLLQTKDKIIILGNSYTGTFLLRILPREEWEAWGILLIHSLMYSRVCSTFTSCEAWGYKLNTKQMKHCLSSVELKNLMVQKKYLFSKQS